MDKRKDSFVSIIIRARNEEKYLGCVLKKLKQQTFQDFEIVVVNNESQDRTEEIAREFGAKIIFLPKNDFTYPYACNLGAKNSVGKFLLFLSAHSIPLANNWLQSGLANFQNDRVAGVYGPTFALPEAPLAEKFFYNFLGKKKKKKKAFFIKPEEAGMGVLGFTNALIRRDLWEKYNLNEEFAAGGEDGDWVKHWLARGYIIIHEPKFAVYHSHCLGLRGLIKQYYHWKKVSRPGKFTFPFRGF